MFDLTCEVLILVTSEWFRDVSLANINSIDYNLSSVPYP